MYLQAVNGFAEDDFFVTGVGGVLSGFTEVTSSSYTINLAPLGQGEVHVQVGPPPAR